MSCSREHRTLTVIKSDDYAGCHSFLRKDGAVRFALPGSYLWQRQRWRADIETLSEASPIVCDGVMRSAGRATLGSWAKQDVMALSQEFLADMLNFGSDSLYGLAPCATDRSRRSPWIALASCTRAVPACPCQKPLSPPCVCLTVPSSGGMSVVLP